MAENIEQRYCTKFCFKIGKTATECFDMMKVAFGNDTMSRARVFDWFCRFKFGRESVKSDPRSGRPSTARNDTTVEAVRTLVRSDRPLTVRELAEDVGISKTVFHEILMEDLGMRR